MLTEASSFQKLLGLAADPDYPHLTAVYEGVDKDGVVGYTFSLSPMGFKAVIEMTLGINKNGAITALSVDSQSETAGLGTKITAGSYLRQYQGAAAESATLTEQIDGITGATVTSKAVVSAVGEAVSYAERELGLVGKADAGLAGSQYLTDAELKLVSLIDGGRTITSLPPYQSLGYEAIEAVYQIDVKGKNAYVITLDADGEIYEAAFDENGEMTLYTADGQAVEQTGGKIGEALSQAREFYSTYLAGKE